GIAWHFFAAINSPIEIIVGIFFLSRLLDIATQGATVTWTQARAASSSATTPTASTS
ncbi:hypothetical protein FIBSPDRAFT_856295, partial [Athelia psychrophila]